MPAVREKERNLVKQVREQLLELAPDVGSARPRRRWRLHLCLLDVLGLVRPLLHAGPKVTPAVTPPDALCPTLQFCITGLRSEESPLE